MPARPTPRTARKSSGKPANSPRATPRKSPGPPSAAATPGPDELLGMDQAIALLKTSRPTFYRWVRQGRIKGHKLGRQWRFYRQDVERFLTGQEPRIDLPADIDPLIRQLAKRVADAGSPVTVSADLGSVPQAVRLMIQLAIQLRASDIHIEPQERADGRPAGLVRLRVDGVLQPVAEIDIRLLPAVVEQWKRMAACDVGEKRRAQDGRIMFGGGQTQGKALDLRVCFLPGVLGEAVTVRLLDPKTVVLDLDRMGFTPRDMETVTRALAAPAGLIILTGPTGCGKTTVLYSMLLRTANPETKVTSIEDPVEYLLPGVTQSQVSLQGGLTFSSAMRAMLRSDPDVLMIGEIRDREALNACMEAALTGHLVMSTLHTEDAAAALVRMVEIGVDPFVVADATNLIMSQRLVRVLCPHCSVPAKTAAHMDRAERFARDGGLDWDGLVKGFREPVGCDRCGRMGYRGRRLIAEFLQVSPALGAALRRGAGVEELRKIAVGEGMRTLTADGVRLAAEGQTSLAEVMRVWRA